MRAGEGRLKFQKLMVNVFPAVEVIQTPRLCGHILLGFLIYSYSLFEQGSHERSATAAATATTTTEKSISLSFIFMFERGGEKDVLRSYDCFEPLI